MSLSNPGVATWPWRAMPVALILALLAGGLAAMSPSVEALVAAWNDPIKTTYSHGALVAGISMWLLWRGRRQLAAALQGNRPRSVALLTLLALLVTLVLWMIAYRAAFAVVHLALLPAVLWCAVLAAFGPAAARACLFPIGFLYFAVPVWDAINSLAQWSTVYAVRGLLRLAGMTVYFDGNRVQIPEGTFEIAEGCSGLHFLVAGLAIAALYGHLERLPALTRIRLLALALLLAAAANWIRVLAIVWVGHLTNMQHYLVRVDHRTFGWVLYILVLPLFFLVANRINRQAATKEPEPPVANTSLANSGLQLAMVVLLLCLPAGLAGISRLSPISSAVELPQLAEIDGWRVTGIRQSGWRPMFRGADLEEMQVLTDGVAEVAVYRAQYLGQQQGAELTAYGNDVAGGWRAATLPSSPRSAGARYTQLVVDPNDPERFLIWMTYRVGRQSFRDGRAAQLWYGVASLMSLHPLPMTVEAIGSRCGQSCETAASAIAHVAAALSSGQSRLQDHS